MEYFLTLLFVGIYFLLLCRSRWVIDLGLTKPILGTVFFVKLLLAGACAYYFYSLPQSDYIAINNEGDYAYRFLKQHPFIFFTSYVQEGQDLGGLFKSSDSFWVDLRSAAFFKIQAVMGFLSNGNFFLNTLIFASFTFLGNLYFYSIFRKIYSQHKWLLIIGCFLLPSMVMYTSCSSKDGIIFVATAGACLLFYRFLAGEIMFSRATVLFFFYLLVIFLFRNYLLMALLPAMFTAGLCKIYPLKKLQIVVGTYLLYFTLFFISGINKSFSLPHAVVNRKADFALLQGGKTDFSMKNLEPSVSGFGANLPQAINHSLFRPYLWEFPAIGIILTALELAAYQLLFLIFIFYRKKTGERIDNFNIFGLLLFVSMMLIIGYTIPNAGAIVRYRSIFWVFILCPMLCNIDWGKFPLTAWLGTKREEA